MKLRHSIVFVINIMCVSEMYITIIAWMTNDAWKQCGTISDCDWLTVYIMYINWSIIWSDIFPLNGSNDTVMYTVGQLGLDYYTVVLY